MTSANDDAQVLRPQGDFPAAGLGRRMAAISYDALLCVALLMVTTFLYKLVWMGFVGEARLRELSDSGALDADPLLSSILLITLFGFFAHFWTRAGQTLGMQVWEYACRTPMERPSAFGRRCCASSSPSHRGCASGWVSSGACSTNRNAAGMTCIPTRSWCECPEPTSEPALRNPPFT